MNSISSAFFDKSLETFTELLEWVNTFFDLLPLFVLLLDCMKEWITLFVVLNLLLFSPSEAMTVAMPLL